MEEPIPMNFLLTTRRGRALRSAMALLATVLALPACAQAPVVTLTPKVVKSTDETGAPLPSK